MNRKLVSWVLFYFENLTQVSCSDHNSNIICLQLETLELFRMISQLCRQPLAGGLYRQIGYEYLVSTVSIYFARVRGIATTNPTLFDDWTTSKPNFSAPKRNDLVRAKYQFVKARWSQRWVRLMQQRLLRKLLDPAFSFILWIDFFGKLSNQAYGTATDFQAEFSQSANWFKKNPFRALGDFFVASSLTILFMFGILQLW